MADLSMGFARDMLSKITGGTIAVVGFLLFAGLIIGIAFYIRYLRQFNIKVEIRSVRNPGAPSTQEVYKIVPDKGGIIYDKKTKTNWFRLKGEKVDLPTPPYDVMQLMADGSNKIEIYQPTHSEYYYVLPSRIDRKQVIREGKSFNVAELEEKIVDPAVGYWGQLKKRDNRTLFNTEHWAMKLLPYLIPALMIIGVIFYTYIWLDKTPQLIEASRKVAVELRAVAEALKDITAAQVTTA